MSEPPTAPDGPGRLTRKRAPRAGDRVRIEEGPARGLVGDVVSVDAAGVTAQVRVWVPGPGGQLRPGIAVVPTRKLRPVDRTSVGAFTPVEPARRGRPRLVSDEMIDKIHQLSESGIYSHAQIALAVGVSKSSVTHYLGQGRPGHRDSS